VLGVVIVSKKKKNFYLIFETDAKRCQFVIVHTDFCSDIFCTKVSCVIDSYRKFHLTLCGCGCHCLLIQLSIRHSRRVTHFVANKNSHTTHRIRRHLVVFCYSKSKEDWRNMESFLTQRDTIHFSQGGWWKNGFVKSTSSLWKETLNRCLPVLQDSKTLINFKSSH